MSVKVDTIVTKDKDTYISYYCYGCGHRHNIPVTGDAKWSYNDNVNNPCVTPSVKHIGGVIECCHYFIRNGYIEYCSDCTHKFAGQSFEMATYNELKKQFEYENP